MKQYVVTSSQYHGELLFKYDLSGNLIAFEIQAELTPQHRLWFFQHLPLQEQTLTVKWTKNSQTMKVVEVPLDLSFETFYEKYNNKYGDKKKARANWEKLTDAQKTLCHIILPRYNRYLERTGIAKIYLERFISKAYYENDYK